MEARWSITYADGSANVYRFAQPEAGAPFTFTYTPVTKERSSSGEYSGGEPVAATYAAGDPRVVEIWTLAEALTANPNLRVEERMMGTGAFTLMSPELQREAIILRSPELDELHRIIARFREGEENAAAAGFPVWAFHGSGPRITAEGEHLVGVGSLASLPNAALSRATVENRARSELMKQLDVFCATLTQAYFKDLDARVPPDPNEERFVAKMIHAYVGILDHPADVVAHHRSESNDYALARYNLSEFLAGLDRAAELPPDAKEFARAHAREVFQRLTETTP